MNTNKKMCLYLALLSATALMANDSVNTNNSNDLPVSDWEQDFGFSSMRKMRKRMSKMLEDIQQIEDELFSSFAKPDKQNVRQLNLKTDVDDNHVIIELNNLKLSKEDAEKINIVRKGNAITVSITTQDGNNIEMKIDHRSIMVTQRHETNKEDKKDDKVTSMYVSTGMMHLARPLPVKVELKDVKASYDDKTGTLRITLLKNEDEITQRIPVATVP